MMTDLLPVMLCLCLWRRYHTARPRYRQRGQQTESKAHGELCHYRTAKKPPWVADTIIRIKALGPDLSCRDIANSFNRLYAGPRRMTVGKTWVAETLRKHQYDIIDVRRRIRGRKGKPGPVNRIWGLDLTGKTDAAGRLHMILGLVDHGSRASLALTSVKDKASLTLLKSLIAVIEVSGKPAIIRTDNEAVFTSRLFRFGLKWLGIRHQTIDLHCPWMNGRIERLFGTLKQKLDRWTVPDHDALNSALAEFRLWYNFIRPHQSLHGRTPAEVWNGTDVYRRKSKKHFWIEAWDGLLSGFYIPP